MQVLCARVRSPERHTSTAWIPAGGDSDYLIVPKGPCHLPRIRRQQILRRFALDATAESGRATGCPTESGAVIGAGELDGRRMDSHRPTRARADDRPHKSQLVPPAAGM